MKKSAISPLHCCRMSLKQLYTYVLYPSTNKGKKYDVWVPKDYGSGFKKVSFGASGYEDYTVHHDADRKRRYQIRHQHDNINDPTYAGFWSWWILWNFPTIEESWHDTLNRFKLHPKAIAM